MFQKWLVPPNLIIISHLLLTHYPGGLTFLPGELKPPGYIPFGQCWGLNAIGQCTDAEGTWCWQSQLLLLSEEGDGTKMKFTQKMCMPFTGHSSAAVNHFGWKFSNLLYCFILDICVICNCVEAWEIIRKISLRLRWWHRCLRKLAGLQSFQNN